MAKKKSTALPWTSLEARRQALARKPRRAAPARKAVKELPESAKKSISVELSPEDRRHGYSVVLRALAHEYPGIPIDVNSGGNIMATRVYLHGWSSDDDHEETIREIKSVIDFAVDNA